MEEVLPKYKVLFLGDQFTGKSSIINRLNQNIFEPNYQATIALDFFSKSIDIDGNMIKLIL